MNNSITEDYCSFEVSKLLKERGFNVRISKSWIEIMPHSVFNYRDGEYNDREGRPPAILSNTHPYEAGLHHCYAPTHALAVKWVRENFNLNLIALPFTSAENPSEFTWIWMIHRVKSSTLDKVYFNSPSDAMEAALLYTLQNLIQ